MPIPSSAETFTQALDPSELKDYSAGVEDLLEVGEDVQSFILLPQQDATDIGFRIKSGGGYPVPVIVGNVLTFWCEIDAAFRARDEWFSGERCALELTIVTNNSPPRVLQRTFAILVKEQ